MNLNQCKSWPHSHPDVMMDLVAHLSGRGPVFKGHLLYGNRDPASDSWRRGKLVHRPAASAHYVVPHIWSAGCWLAIGLLTRFAAVAQLPILIGAVLWHLPEFHADERGTRQNLELSALVLFLTCLVCLHGSGRFSVDHLITKGEPQETPPVAQSQRDDAVVNGMFAVITRE